MGKQTWLVLLILLLLPAQAADLILVDKAAPQVRRYDLQNAKVLQQTELASLPVQLWLSGKVAYLLDSNENRLRSYDTQTLQILQTAKIPGDAAALVGDSEYLWVIHGGTFKVTQLRRSDLSLVQSKNLGEANPYLLSPEIALEGNRLWITNPVTGALLVLDSRTLTVQNTLNLADGNSYLMPLAVREGKIYITLRERLYVLDSATGKTLQQISLRDPVFTGRPVTISQVLVSSDRIYAVEPTTDQIFVFDRTTLDRQPSLKFATKLGTVYLDAKGRLYIPFAGRGEVVVQINQTPLKIKVGGSPALVWWTEE